MLLQRLDNHQVAIAHDGMQALQQLEAFHPEIILLDIGLPGMDGYQLARTIRNRQQFRDVFLVAVTGYGQAEDRRRSLEAGFDEHLVKPLAAAEVEKLFGHPKLVAAFHPLHRMTPNWRLCTWPSRSMRMTRSSSSEAPDSVSHQLQELQQALTCHDPQQPDIRESAQ